MHAHMPIYIHMYVIRKYGRSSKALNDLLIWIFLGKIFKTHKVFQLKRKSYVLNSIYGFPLSRTTIATSLPMYLSRNT